MVLKWQASRSPPDSYGPAPREQCTVVTVRGRLPGPPVVGGWAVPAASCLCDLTACVNQRRGLSPDDPGWASFQSSHKSRDLSELGEDLLPVGEQCDLGLDLQVLLSHPAVLLKHRHGLFGVGAWGQGLGHSHIAFKHTSGCFDKTRTSQRKNR